MKTKLNLIQVSLLCAAMLPAVVQAQFAYTANGGAATITGFTGSGGIVTIPSTIGGLPVTSIGANAFSGRSGMNCVIMPNSVTSIGGFAFSGCANLLSVFFGVNAPSADSTVFSGDTHALVYYVSGTTGWTSTFGGVQTVLPPFNYNLHTFADGSLVIVITGYTGSGDAVTIPSAIGGLPVTSIASFAFQNSGLTSITIPDSVTNIGSASFYGCTNLTSATTGNGISSIPTSAFYNCTSLTNITIGNGINIINDSAFQHCGLATVTTPNNITAIRSYAFADCTNLNAFYLPGIALSNIDSTVFSGDSNAEVYLNLPMPFNYNINNGVITITSYSGSSGAVTIPTGIYIPLGIHPPGSFSGLPILLPVTSIGDNTFSGCSSLISVSIPNSVTNIGSHSFSDCTNLLSVFFGTNAPSVDPTTFSNDNNASVYYLPGTAGWSSTLGGVPTVLLPYSYTAANAAITIRGYTGPGGAVAIPGTIGGLPVTSIANEAFYKCASLTSVTLPNTITNIGHGAFASCSNLTSANIPDSVTSLGISAFWNCSSLASVTIGTNVTSIGASDFDSCTSLKSVTIPNSVLKIGGAAFQNSASLTNVTIGKGATTIGNSAFDSCSSLTAILVDPLNMNYGSAGGILLNKTRNTLIQYPGGRTWGYTDINGITNIGNSAFAFCSKLTNITFASSVNRIGDWAFDSCTSLISATIPNSVTSIGDSAFESCTSLTNLSSQTIPSSITSIGPHAFDGCSGLTNVAIPDNITRIGSWAFADCTSLTTVTIGTGVTSIGSGTFDFCTSLTGVYFQTDRPSLGVVGFTNDTAAVVYYLPGTLFWGTTFGGAPTALWLPQIQPGKFLNFLGANQFRFSLSWASGRIVVVEACTNLVNPVWSSVGTIITTNTPSFFGDLQSDNYPSRFYRLRSP